MRYSPRLPSGPNYRNELTLIRKEAPYRPPVDCSRISQITGVISAQIETTGGDSIRLLQ